MFQIQFHVVGEDSARHIVFYTGSQLVPQIGDSILLPKVEGGFDSYVVCERRFILAQHGNQDAEAIVSNVRIQLCEKLP